MSAEADDVVAVGEGEGGFGCVRGDDYLGLVRTCEGGGGGGGCVLEGTWSGCVRSWHLVGDRMWSRVYVRR